MLSPLFKQSWVVLGVLLNMLGQGMLVGYTSVLLPPLQAPGAEIKVDIYSASIIASMIGAVGMFGFFTSAILMDLCGRKFVHGLVAVPGIVGWLCIYYADSVTLLIVGRAFGGFAAGATVSLGAIVIGEYTSPKNRGMFLNLKTAAVCLGNLVVHVLGHFYQWRTVAVLSVWPLAASLLNVCTWPESPAWLVSKSKYKESEKSFYWLNGRNEESVNEIENLLTAQKERMANDFKNVSFGGKLVQILKKFTRKDFLKPVMIIFFACICLEACGRHVFPAFASQIIGEVTGSKSHKFYYTLGIDSIITASAIFSSVLVKLMKRRTLLFATGFLSLIVLYCICGYMYLVSVDILSSERTYIPMVLFVVYFILSNLGCTPIPMALLGEIFPLAHRGVGSSVAGFIFSMCVTLAMKVTPYLLVHIKVHGTFAFFGTILGLSLAVLWFILPETKDRTLQEIEDYIYNGEFKQIVDKEANVTMIPPQKNYDV
ncbi:facilitated trehalose transporter Tret1-like [Aricia agestis]|uniref:facilitated trehalose transporter Tret1-like n=1 Tax=Aricia agestis TaxID=91739 RepID=UPI001C20A009|nr:facilitated trehalose transporter Tret1-like [Aricia agestis]